eukprot:1806143-Amphidinium_carterae.1
MEDSSFAIEAKSVYHILRIHMISGRLAFVLVSRTKNLQTEAVLQKCCDKLGISSAGSMCLVSGGDVVPARTDVHDWPGIQAPGEISEYQLVISTCKHQ